MNSIRAYQCVTNAASRIISAVLIFLVFFNTNVVNAAAPQLINYQARLNGPSGNPLDTTVDVVFTVYNHPTANNILWTESYGGMTITDGNLSVLLGSLATMPDSLFKGTECYLGIKVGADPEITPRNRLASVPYAFRLESVDGAKAGDLSGALSLIIDESKAIGDALLVKNQAGEVLFSVKIGALGAAEMSIFDPVDSKDGSRAVEPRITMTKDGIVMHGATAADTNVLLLPNGNISTKGQIAMGENSSGATWSTVFGFNNSGSGDSSTVCGGYNNVASGRLSAISGGRDNYTSGWYSNIGGGLENINSGYASTIGGGEANIASVGHSTVGGGLSNTASYLYATIGGGSGNTASEARATIGGGQSNAASGVWSTIGGGVSNVASFGSTTVGGGGNNTAGGEYATVGGGQNNSADGYSSIIGGGFANTAESLYSCLLGGFGNSSNHYYASVGGGFIDSASGQYATVPGGYRNNAQGTASFAAGYGSKALHGGSFVWSDTIVSNFSSSTVNEFNIRSTGGVRIFTDSALTSGVTMGSGASSWTSVSDKSVKKEFREINSEELLKKLSEIPISRWKYIAEESQADHIGPMSQDFYSAFGLGDDDKRISTIDADGVALAAIQALYKENQELKKRLEKLELQLNQK